jgi:hypothetical protein
LRGQSENEEEEMGNSGKNDERAVRQVISLVEVFLQYFVIYY